MFRSQFKLLPRIRCLITLRIKSSIINIDSTITDNIIRHGTSGRSLRYSRETVGPRMEPWGTPALTGYSCEEFSSRTTRSRLLLRKEEKRPYIWPEIPHDLSLWRRPPCQTLSKALDMQSATTAWVAPDLLQGLAILSDTTVRRSKIDREDLKPYSKSEKESHFPRWSTILLFTSFSRLYRPRRKTGR